MKVCIIIPYYGKWPKYIDLYLKSLSRQPWLEVLFFTDLEQPLNAPENAHFRLFSLSDFKNRVHQKLGVMPVINSPYKLCDFKPAYGKIFEEEIEEYDYWGWGDVDLVYGDIRTYVKEDLGEKDVISMRKNWISGSFCLMRNSQPIKDLFMENNYYREAFAISDYTGFDECALQWEQVRRDPTILPIQANMTSIVFGYQSKQEIATSFHDRIAEKINKKGWIKVHQGLISDAHEVEYAFYHFISEKAHPYFTFPNWKMIPNTYFINQFGFFTTQEFGQGRQLLSIWRVLGAVPNQVLRLLKRVKNKLFNLR